MNTSYMGCDIKNQTQEVGSREIGKNRSNSINIPEALRHTENKIK